MASKPYEYHASLPSLASGIRNFLFLRTGRCLKSWLPRVRQFAPRRCRQRRPGPDAQRHLSLHRFRRGAIKSLDGELVPVKPAECPVFDKKDSFHIRIASAEISIAASDLASIFNSYVFARPNTPLSDLSVSIEKGRVKIKGRLHKAGEVPIETEGLLTPTSDGKILLHAAKVKALHVPVKRLMNLFGVEIADLIKAAKFPASNPAKTI